MCVYVLFFVDDVLGIDLSKSISVSHLPSSERLTADIPAMMLAFGLALAKESQ